MLAVVLFSSPVWAQSPAGDAQAVPRAPQEVDGPGQRVGQGMDQAAGQAVGQAVLDAEALIVKSDWVGAEAKLDPWVAEHPTDARALFDAAYAADAQNKLDKAEGLYRRAVE